MSEQRQSMTWGRISAPKKDWLYWAILLAVGATLMWLAPEEQTLGSGIRSVYVHVALIWVGMVGLALAGILGVGVLIWAGERAVNWMQTIGWVGLAFYAAGLAMSILASKVNWGNVFWQEPRMRVALNMFAMALIVEIVISWLPWVRLRGLLSIGLIAILLWATLRAPLVLHPSNPIQTSSSSAIQLTFAGLFLICGLGAAWLVWKLARGGRADL